MADTIPDEQAPATFALPARLDTDAAPKLREALISHRGEPLCLDAGAVTRLGGLCLTILASATRSWEVDGNALILNTPSDAFTSACTRLGINPAALSTGTEEAA